MTSGTGSASGCSDDTIVVYEYVLQTYTVYVYIYIIITVSHADRNCNFTSSADRHENRSFSTMFNLDSWIRTTLAVTCMHNIN